MPEMSMMECVLQVMTALLLVGIWTVAGRMTDRTARRKRHGAGTD